MNAVLQDPNELLMRGLVRSVLTSPAQKIAVIVDGVVYACFVSSLRPILTSPFELQINLVLKATGEPIDTVKNRPVERLSPPRAKKKAPRKGGKK